MRRDAASVGRQSFLARRWLCQYSVYAGVETPESVLDAAHCFGLAMGHTFRSLELAYDLGFLRGTGELPEDPKE